MQNSSSLVKLSELLSDNEFHDGTSIGHQLNITRAAVWKIIKKFAEYGVEIHSVKGKGYLLKSPLILLDKKKIQAHLKKELTQLIHLTILEKVESTNTYLKKMAERSKKIEICISEMQTKGRGRFNRQWYSPFGQNIYCSMRNSFQKDISELSGLSLVTGLAICHALEETTQMKDTFFVKWPNDIVVKQKKVAGILIEIQAESNGFCHAIFGIGINVNMQNANKKEINQTWDSLQKISEHYYDRNILCAELINTMADYLKRFSKLGLSDFISEWKKRDALFDQPVKLATGNVNLSGVGSGINEHGHLLLKMDDKSTRAFSSGDTTLAK